MKHLERLLLPGFFRSCRLRRGTADPELVEPGITGTTTPNPPPRARQSSAQRPARGTAKPADSLLPQADGVRPPLYVEDVGQRVLVRAGRGRKGDSEHRLQKNVLRGQVETRRASTRAQCFPRAGAASAVPAAAAPITAPAHLCPPAPPVPQRTCAPSSPQPPYRGVSGQQPRDHALGQHRGACGETRRAEPGERGPGTPGPPHSHSSSASSSSARRGPIALFNGPTAPFNGPTRPGKQRRDQSTVQNLSFIACSHTGWGTALCRSPERCGEQSGVSPCPPSSGHRDRRTLTKESQ